MGASVDENAFFPVAMTSNTYSYSYPSWDSKWTHAYLKKNKSYFSKKIFLLKFNFQDESYLHANCLFCILILCRRCFSFQFLYFGIRKHISILIGASLAEKMWYFSEKCSFWSLISKMKISCMLNVSFIFCLFTVNAFFFSS